MQNIITLENASKHYGTIKALDKLDLNIHRGEVVALLGANGAGKTTAINLMLGLMRPTAGRVRLFGGDPQRLEARTRVGTMLQLSGVPDTVTVEEHLTLFRAYYPNPLPLEQTLKACGLEGLERRLYGKLSGGQRQRLHLALATCGDPELLFLDEPTTGLDVSSRRALWENVRTFIKGGRTVVLTTHYLEEADALADRIVVIDRGRLIAEGTPAEIKARAAGKRIRCVTSLAPDTLRSLTGVTRLRQDGAAQEILSTAAEATLRDLLGRDPHVSDLEVTGAGLEEAFLALTEEETAIEEAFV